MALGVDPLRNTFSMRTGVAHLRGLPSPLLLDLAFLRGGPDVLIGPIMHEIVHHACANSAVNIALQYRWLELLRLMLSTPALSWAVHEEHMERAADLAAAEAVLQPLAEGIAHFSEFDCPVPESQLGPEAMLGPTDALLWRLLSLKAGVGPLRDDLFRQWSAEQLDPRTVERKTNVLSNPVRPTTGGDTYLLGYLTVKSLWARFIGGRRDERLRAPSFLNFVMYYIYEDWGLSQLLMTPGPIPWRAAADRLSDRLKSLFESDLGGLVAAFTDDMAARSAQRSYLKRGPEELTHGVFPGLGLSREEVVAGMKATQRFFDERVGPGAPISPPYIIQGLRNLQYLAMVEPLDPARPDVARWRESHHVPPGWPVRLLDGVLDVPQQKRAYCFLMDIAVEVRRGEGNQLLLSAPGEGEARAAPTTEWAASRFTDAPQTCRLVGVITSTASPWPFHCILLRDGKFVCLWSHGDPGTEERREVDRLIDIILTEMQMETITQVSFVQLNSFLMTNEQVREEVSGAADRATQVMVEALRGLLDGAGWSGLLRRQVRHDFGIGNVVPRKGVKCLALAGLCNAFRRDGQEVDRLMRTAGYSLSEALELSALAERDAGVTLIRTQDDGIHVQI